MSTINPTVVHQQFCAEITAHVSSHFPITPFRTEQENHSNIPTLKDLSAKYIANKLNDLLFTPEQLAPLPLELKIYLMDYAKDFNLQKWIEFRIYFTPQAREEIAKDLLQTKGISYTFVDSKMLGMTAEEKLLVSAFNETVPLLSLKDKKHIIALKRQVSINAISVRIQTLSEKVQETVISILKSPYFYYPIAFATSIFVYIKLRRGIDMTKDIAFNTLMPKAWEWIKNSEHSIVSRMGHYTHQTGSRLYHFYKNHQLKLLLGTIFLPLVTPRHAICQVPLTVMKRIVWLPYDIRDTIVNCISHVSDFCFKKVTVISLQTGNQLEQITQRQMIQRIQNELPEARQIWIDSIVSLNNRNP